jgi:hypothetical protein
MKSLLSEAFQGVARASFGECGRDLFRITTPLCHVFHKFRNLPLKLILSPQTFGSQRIIGIMFSRKKTVKDAYPIFVN